MFHDTFCKVAIRGLSLNEVAQLYAKWVLGTSDSDNGDCKKAGRIRKNREYEGIDEKWDVNQLLQSGTLHGSHGCEVDVRRDSSTFVFRFIHRDTTDPAIFWHIVARSTMANGWLTIEHAVGRGAPREVRLFPIASPSRIINDLIRVRGTDVSPHDLLIPLTKLDNADSVERFVDYVLLRPQRELPIVVVACGNRGESPYVDVEKLDRLLRGVANVAVLETELATYAFSHSIASRGLSLEHRCFNGAIHSYGATSLIKEDHRLWLGENLLSINEKNRSAVVAGIISHRLAIRSTPPGFFSSVEVFDSQERRRAAETFKALETHSRPHSRITEGYVTSLEAQLAGSVERESSTMKLWVDSDEACKQLLADKDDLESQLAQAKQYREQLQEKLQETKNSSPTSINEELVTSLRSLMADKVRPEDCLILIGAAFAERLVILDEAFKSARKSSEFRHGSKLLNLFHKLAGPYYDSLCDGKGDTYASRVFGNNDFAANESDKTMHNQRAIRERTRVYKGEKIVLWPHLKIGIKETTAETIRVHFYWSAHEQKIIIGHCGEHLYRVG